MISKWSKLASDEEIAKTIESLKKNGVEAELVKNKEDAKKRALELIPLGAEIMTMTSITLENLGLTQEINESGKYETTRKKFATMDKIKDKNRMKQIGAAPEYTIGSVQAITEEGEIFIASGTGSQIPAYAYGSEHVIFIVGTHKIVKNKDEALKRIYEHALPMESERAKKAYGVPGSSVSKLLIINKDKPGRTNVIFIPEVLGY